MNLGMLVCSMPKVGPGHKKSHRLLFFSLVSLLFLSWSLLLAIARYCLFVSPVLFPLFPLFPLLSSAVLNNDLQL